MASSWAKLVADNIPDKTQEKKPTIIPQPTLQQQILDPSYLQRLRAIADEKCWADDTSLNKTAAFMFFSRNGQLDYDFGLSGKGACAETNAIPTKVTRTYLYSLAYEIGPEKGKRGFWKKACANCRNFHGIGDVLNAETIKDLAPAAKAIDP